MKSSIISEKIPNRSNIVSDISISQEDRILFSGIILMESEKRFIGIGTGEFSNQCVQGEKNETIVMLSVSEKGNTVLSYSGCINGKGILGILNVTTGDYQETIKIVGRISSRREEKEIIERYRILSGNTVAKKRLKIVNKG